MSLGKEISLIISKLRKLTVLYLTKLGPWEIGCIVKHIIKVPYCQGNIDIVSYCENLKGANP